MLGCQLIAFRQSNDDPPHHIPFHRVAVLRTADKTDTVSSLAQIDKAVGAAFEFRLIVRSVPMSGPLDDAELRGVRGKGRMNIHRQDN